MYIGKVPQNLACTDCRSKDSDPEPDPEYPMRGLGDLIEKVTKKTGVKWVVDKVAKKTGKDCGCGKRRDKLNQAVPFGGKS